MTEIPARNVTQQPRLPHMELMNLQTGDVWLSQAPITFEAFKLFRAAPPLIKSGCATASFDAAHFLRSPGADMDGALETTTIEGREFVRVARALKINGTFRGETPTLVKVQKHHRMTFAAGAQVTIARLPDGGHFVQQTESVPGKTFVRPPDWQLHQRRLDADWTLLMPPPVDVWFFASLASFQGPLSAADLAAIGIDARKVDTV